MREEKDRLDREQAVKSQQNGSNSSESENQHQPRSAIATGRTGSIGNAISMFNKAEEKPIAPIQRVSDRKSESSNKKLKFNNDCIWIYRKSQSSFQKNLNFRNQLHFQ